MKRQITSEVKRGLKKAAKAMGIDISASVPFKTGKTNVMSRIYHAYESGSRTSLNRRLPGGVRVELVIESFHQNENKGASSVC